VHPTQVIEIFGNISAASIGHPLEMEMGAGMNLSGGWEREQCAVIGIGEIWIHKYHCRRPIVQIRF